MLTQGFVIVGLAAAVLAGGAETRQSGASVCSPAGSLMRLDGLPEASGLVASQSSATRLWAHNDSGTPEIFALETSGKVAGRVAISGAALEDWEAMATSRCANGTCLYLADIGDNDASRKEITVYRVTEPAGPGASVKVDAVLRATYPDGAHDAETLLAAPDGTLYIVTKGDTGPIALFRFPRDVRPGASVRLERVGTLADDKSPETARVTDGAISRDGAWVALRTRGSVTFYRADEFLTGTFEEVHRVDLGSLNEPQGEAVAFGASGTVWLAGEGGGKSQPGTLASLSCAL